MLTDLWRILTSPQARKCQVAIIALIASAAAAGLFPAAIAIWINLAVTALSVAGIYVVPNSNTAVLEPTKKAELIVPEQPVVVQEQPVQAMYRGDVRG